MGRAAPTAAPAMQSKVTPVTLRSSTSGASPRSAGANRHYTRALARHSTDTRRSGSCALPPIERALHDLETLALSHWRFSRNSQQGRDLGDARPTRLHRRNAVYAGDAAILWA